MLHNGFNRNRPITAENDVLQGRNNPIMNEDDTCKTGSATSLVPAENRLQWSSDDEQSCDCNSFDREETLKNHQHEFSVDKKAISRCQVSSPFSKKAPLFYEDESEQPHSIPGSIHKLSDESLQRLIDKLGTIQLVRQLGKDVAERDAVISDIKYYYESREEMYRNILREHGLDPVLASIKHAQANDTPGEMRSKRVEVWSPYMHSLRHRLHRAMSDELVTASSDSDSPATPLVTSQRNDQTIDDHESEGNIKTKSAAPATAVVPASAAGFIRQLNSSSPCNDTAMFPCSGNAQKESQKKPTFLSQLKFVKQQTSNVRTSPVAPSALPAPQFWSNEFLSSSTSNAKTPDGEVPVTNTSLLASSCPSPSPSPKSSSRPLHASIHRRGTSVYAHNFHNSAVPNFLADSSIVEMDTMVPKDFQPPTMRLEWANSPCDKGPFLDEYGFLLDRNEDNSSSQNESRNTSKSHNKREPISSLDIDDHAATTSQSAGLSNLASSTLIRAQREFDRNLLLQESLCSKWNEFFCKLYSKLNLTYEKSNGLLGISHIASHGKNGGRRWKVFRKLVLHGVPMPFRSKVWMECSGANQLYVPGYYQELLQRSMKEGANESVDQINMDIRRTMAGNVFFGGNGPGVPKLRSVLLAYSVHNQQVGYCQGMNVITGFLLLLYASEEDAFYVLMSIVERMLPPDYFSSNLLGSRADQLILKELVKELLPKLHQHLEQLSVDLEANTIKWFLSLYTDTLPARLAFRVLDVFFCDGSVTLFRVALHILKTLQQQLLQCTSSSSVYVLLGNLMQYPFNNESFVEQSSIIWASSIQSNDIARRRAAAVQSLMCDTRDIDD